MKHLKLSPGVLMLDVEGLTLTAQDCELLARKEVGGLILFTRNFASLAQLEDLVVSIRECNEQILIAVDQEGGRVQRFRQGFLQLPALYKIGRRYRENRDDGRFAARECAWAMAVELLRLGIDFSFAPVLDLYSSASQVIAERAFSADVDELIDLARSYIAGMHDAGMAATGKHFPGHGTVLADSHVELPQDDRSLEEIRQSDLRVFAACASQLDGIMPAHVIYPQIDQSCAGFSQRWIEDILREELGFEGVVFSDDLTMEAARTAGSVVSRAEQALKAGCDMVLVCNQRQDAVEVADWLQAQEHPGNNALARMSACRENFDASYSQSSRWTEAVSLITDLNSKE